MTSSQHHDQTGLDADLEPEDHRERPELFYGRRPKPDPAPSRTRQRIGLVVAFLLLLWAWWEYPWTKQQCLERAARQPAFNGVEIMRQLCEKEFPK